MCHMPLSMEPITESIERATTNLWDIAGSAPMMEILITCPAGSDPRKMAGDQR